MKIDRRALKESLSDVAVGVVIALPLSFLFLTCAIILMLAC
jgi:hypothetical protein